MRPACSGASDGGYLPGPAEIGAERSVPVASDQCPIQQRNRDALLADAGSAVGPVAHRTGTDFLEIIKAIPREILGSDRPVSPNLVGDGVALSDFLSWRRCESACLQPVRVNVRYSW